MLLLLLSVLAGILFGIVTGLVPGVHVNLVSAFVLELSTGVLSGVSPLALALFVLAMAVTHSFLDTIPSIFLGAPEEATALGVLPGHRMLLQGNGKGAVLLTVVGSLGGLVLSLALLPLFELILVPVYSFLRPWLAWILIALVVVLFFQERRPLFALLLFLLSGVLGLYSFSLDMDQVLFPLLSGLFGVAVLLMSFFEKSSLPPQDDCTMDTRQTTVAVVLSVFLGWLASFLPGFGPSQAAALSRVFVRLRTEGFLILVGGLSTVNMVLSILSLYSLEKARNGAVVAISSLLEMDYSLYLFFSLVALFVGGIASLLAIFLSSSFLRYTANISYRTLTLCVLVFLGVLVFVLTGYRGLFVLVLATGVGILPSLLQVRRSQLLGCLLLPVILYFL